MKTLQLILIAIVILSIISTIVSHASAHGICTGLQSRYGRFDGVVLSNQILQTGSTLTISGKIVSSATNDMTGLFRMWSNSTTIGVWEVVSKEPYGYKINISPNEVTPFSITIKALKSGSYRISPQIYFGNMGAISLSDGCHREPKVIVTGNSIQLPNLSPLKQFESGVAANDIKCEQGLQLVIKAEDNSPACVKPDTASSLVKMSWALPGPKDFGYNPGRGPVTLEKQAPAKFSSLGPDPFSPSTLNRLVFFIKSNSTAQIYVQYTSDLENTGNVTTGGQGYTGNPDHFIPLNSSQIIISSSPDHVSMSQGTNTTVVYDISTKNIPSGLYWVSLTPICGAMPVAIDMDSSQIIPSDIPVYVEHCGVEVLNYKILGISGGTVEYKLSPELQ